MLNTLPFLNIFGFVRKIFSTNLESTLNLIIATLKTDSANPQKNILAVLFVASIKEQIIPISSPSGGSHHLERMNLKRLIWSSNYQTGKASEGPFLKRIMPKLGRKQRNEKKLYI